MNNYKEPGNCPICKIKFNQNDDIVVCPKCGAPYHRECYNSLGHCLFEEKHASNFSYFKSHYCDENKKDKNETTKKCPHCFYDNPSGSLFCNNCGFPFANNTSNSQNFSDIPNINYFSLDSLFGIDENETINNIKISEIAEYVKSNVIYYIPVFKNISLKNKSRFNFSAFLFSGAWFLYRKLYKIGVVLTSIVTLLTILSNFIELTYAREILNPIINSIGINSSAGLTVDSYYELINQFSLLPIEQKFIIFLPSIIKLINFIIMILSGSIANKIYYKSCTSKILQIKTLCKNDTKLYSEEINKYGGINFKIIPLLLICYTIIEYLPQFIL